MATDPEYCFLSSSVYASLRYILLYCPVNADNSTLHTWSVWLHTYVYQWWDRLPYDGLVDIWPCHSAHLACIFSDFIMFGCFLPCIPVEWTVNLRNKILSFPPQTVLVFFFKHETFLCSDNPHNQLIPSHLIMVILKLGMTHVCICMYITVSLMCSSLHGHDYIKAQTCHSYSLFQNVSRTFEVVS